MKHGHLPVFEVAQRRRGDVFDLAALPVEVGEAAVLLGDDIVTGDRDRGELLEQLVFAAPPRLLLGVEPVTGSGQPGKVLPRGGTTTGAPRALPGRRGRLDHQGWTPHRRQQQQDHDTGGRLCAAAVSADRRTGQNRPSRLAAWPKTPGQKMTEAADSERPTGRRRWPSQRGHPQPRGDASTDDVTVS
ncbi:hypothetical protein ACFPM0_37130 [Pseudonocardia sulfidoxydans]|uniref:hypothetical protein n=1 Tax=Pseudonocardia sulfidoxydans TaxID=54011 RepID=UPI00360A9792